MHTMKRLGNSPTAIFWLAIFACLALFWVSLLFPRSDNQLIGSDGVFYYSYLPSLLLDHDLDFSDEYGVFFADNPAEGDIWLHKSHRTAKGVPRNQWSIGPALLWSPFFLATHTVAHILHASGLSIDIWGYGMLYQAVVISANILFAGIGLWYIYRLVATIINQTDALIATLLVLFAGNLIYYMSVEPHMAHSGVLMIVGVFFWLWHKAEGEITPLLAIKLGVLGGLMALIRPQAGLLLSIPFALALPQLWQAIKARDVALTLHWIGTGLVAALVAFIVFIPQMLIWKSMYGGYFSSGYADGGSQLFYWWQPKLWQTLFSSARGLFVWHPIFLVALGGLWFVPRLGKAARQMTIAGIMTFLMQWYLISSWNNWWQGYAFGGRMFLVCTPFFVLGLAALVQQIRSRFDWRLPTLIALGLIGFNWLFIIQYRLVLFTKIVFPTWYDVTVRRVTFLFEIFG